MPTIEIVMPDHVYVQVKDAIQLCEHVAPTWMDSLEVRFSEASPDTNNDTMALAECQPLYQYRKATFTLYPGILGCSETMKCSVLVHEMVHCLQAPLISIFEQVVSSITEDGTVVRNLISTGGHVAIESSCQDITNVFLKFFESIRQEQENNMPKRARPVRKRK